MGDPVGQSQKAIDLTDPEKVGFQPAAVPRDQSPDLAWRWGRPAFAACCLCALYFLVFIGAQVLQNASAGSSPLSGDGDATRQLVYLVIFGLAAGSIAYPWNPRPFVLFPLSLIALMAWCWLSLSWAIEPGIAVRRLALTTMILLTIFVLVDQAGVRNALNALAALLILALVINFAWVFLGRGTHLAGEFDPALVGNWRGVTIHKNVAGALCAITIIALGLDTGSRNRFARLAVSAAAAYFLVNTQSKTSMGLLVGSLVVGFVYSRVEAKKRRRMVILAALAAILFLLLGRDYWGALPEIFSQPDAFTGRVQIWPMLLQYAASNPIFGSGYGSFWNIGAASPILRMSNSWVSTLATGHNGYLDVVVQIGVPGLVLAVISTILGPFWTLATERIPAELGGRLIALLVFCAGHNLTESSLLDRDMVVWVVLVSVVAITQKAVHGYSPPNIQAQDASPVAGWMSR